MNLRTKAKKAALTVVTRSTEKAEVEELDSGIGTLSYLDSMGAATQQHVQWLKNMRKRRKALEVKHGLEPWWNAEP